MALEKERQSLLFPDRQRAGPEYGAVLGRVVRQHLRAGAGAGGVAVVAAAAEVDL